METERLTHTAASLAALAPRELDVLAHETVMQQRVVDLRQSDDAIVSLYEIDNKAVPHYSTDLNAAAPLVESLGGARFLKGEWYRYLLEQFHGYSFQARHIAAATASAKLRTIAAILAVQDSPYSQIVTWDKHPKDAANSQSAQGAK